MLQRNGELRMPQILQSVSKSAIFKGAKNMIKSKKAKITGYLLALLFFISGYALYFYEAYVSEKKENNLNQEIATLSSAIDKYEIAAESNKNTIILLKKERDTIKAGLNNLYKRNIEIEKKYSDLLERTSDLKDGPVAPTLNEFLKGL